MSNFYLGYIALKNKYTKWYIDLISKATSRLIMNSRTYAKETLGVYIEGHHILPRCICENQNQIKDSNNIVYLTYREHIIAHMMLCRMFQNNIKFKMQHACAAFFKVNQTRKSQYAEFAKNTRLLQKLKEEYRNKQIEFMNSPQNPHLGRKRSEECKENMRRAWKNLDKTNHKVGKWVRTEEQRKRLSEAKKGLTTGENNGMSKQENRDKVGLSKIGRKRFYNTDKTKFKYCFPGTEPIGFHMG